MSDKIQERSDEPAGTDEASKFRQILAALKHPDCPIDMFDFDAQKLARHISIRMTRRYMRKK